MKNFVKLLISFFIFTNISNAQVIQDTIQVYAGWNNIGSLSTGITSDIIKSEPLEIIVSSFYGYSGGYYIAYTLSRGKGYWVKVNQDGLIIMTSDSGTMGTPCIGIPTVEYAGKTYNTVQIGNQCWLKENLDVGIMVDSLQDQSDNSAVEKYCYNNDTNNCNIYGGLYQWDEAMKYTTTEGARGICPTGWHIPRYDENQTLSATVGGDANVLKAIGQGTGAGAGTNTSGFSALLAGYRLNNGYFTNLGYNTYFWSSTGYNSVYTYGMYLYGNDSYIYVTDYSNRKYGFSIRCLKD